jgi:tetratricopeptide (TPR) repeat protein
MARTDTNRAAANRKACHAASTIKPRSMMHSENDRWQLVLGHRYVEALAAYDARARAEPITDYIEIADRATALLCLGRHSEALDGFRRASELSYKGSGAYLEEIGAVLWLLDRRVEAIQTFRQAAEGILKGSIHYADLAGGVSEGLLLWYAGITNKDGAATEFAVRYLSKLSRKRRIKSWPGPLALFALGRTSFNRVLEDKWWTDDLSRIMTQAQVDLLKRRELVQALFYLATSKRLAGAEDECHSLMAQCSVLENPVLEVEWYLARAEVERQRKSDRG